jgi:hypothetical protein
LDRNGKSKRREQQQAAMRKKDEDSVGSDLPTVDQFEIAVPSKSFASTGEDAHFPEDTREDEPFDTRSNSDVSSITSVSYRAGYYYLRNAKKQLPEKKGAESTSCCVAPTCSCSWFSCCCCAEAKSELATMPTSKNSIVMQQKQRKSHPSPSARRAMLLAQQQEMAQSMHARGPVHAGFVHPDAAAGAALNGRSRGMRQSSSRRQSHHRSSSRGRYHPNAMVDPTLLAMEPPRHPMAAAVDPQIMRGAGGGMDHPGLQQNHSLFDELSEDTMNPNF